MIYHLTLEQNRTIKQLMTATGVKQRALAQALDIKESNFSRILSGGVRCTWGVEEWEKLAQVLNLDVKTLLAKLNLSFLFSNEAAATTSTEPKPGGGALSGTAFIEFTDFVRTFDGTWSYDRQEELGLTFRVLPDEPQPSSAYVAVQVKSKALEPHVMFDDIIVIDTSATDIKEDGIYALMLDGYFAVRFGHVPQLGRIYFTANDKEAYPVIGASGDANDRSQRHIDIIGRVVSLMRKLT